MDNSLNLPEEIGWEYHHVTVSRVPGFGFGIAVSGGRDNPHFASGDPSIAVSDVLTSGPAELILQVNDRIISVNGIPLQNVDYATAIQVLRDSGDTVALVVKRRTPPMSNPPFYNHNHHPYQVQQHQLPVQPLYHHNHNHSASSMPFTYSPPAFTPPVKVTLTKNSKKEDFGITLGCKLFVKEISSRAKEQLLTTNQMLMEGDFVTKINNLTCNDTMSLKEAKKIMDSSKDKLHLYVARDVSNNANVSHHRTQSSISSINQYLKGDELTPVQSYSNQNLYVQPPTRNPNVNGHSNYNEHKSEQIIDLLLASEDKLNPSPAKLSRASSSHDQLDLHNGANNIYGRTNGTSSASPRQLSNDDSSISKDLSLNRQSVQQTQEDYYGTRRNLYNDERGTNNVAMQTSEPRFITFQKDGSVGIRLIGGNHVGIFVTAVQSGSPASTQGLQPGDKILKVNDMDMSGATREEAVLFLLSLQDRIELIVQYLKEEYDNVIMSQEGDSFYIKTHFHYENPSKSESGFRSGEIFHVVDTLYNGVVGCWQVYKIGMHNKEVQKGIIPNKSRAEELATAQFNATKKEMSTTESKGIFFRRKRSTNRRRSKSLGKEHWDDILFSDCTSKFPAYERVVLKHPGFTRPVILFGPIADIAREKMLKDFPDKFISPQSENNNDSDTRSQKSSNIIRLSSIRDVISTGKHALLDVTPNAVERLNYAQLYPIAIFLKADSKITIKQIRQHSIIKLNSTCKSSKKLLEQSQKIEKAWSHVFSWCINLDDSIENWYRKLRETIDRHQSEALWISECKPQESLSDDFLFSMSSVRLSYASSPESDIDHSPTRKSPTPNSNSKPLITKLTKSSSDPNLAVTDTHSNETLPPYQSNLESKYGFLERNSINNNGSRGDQIDQTYANKSSIMASIENNDMNGVAPHRKHPSYSAHLENHEKRCSPKETMYNQRAIPILPPRIDRNIKPGFQPKYPVTNANTRSAHERLFGNKLNGSLVENHEQLNNNENSFGKSTNSANSIENHHPISPKTDSLSSYDSYQNSKQSMTNNVPSNFESKPAVSNDLASYGQSDAGDQNFKQYDHARYNGDSIYSTNKSNRSPSIKYNSNGQPQFNGNAIYNGYESHHHPVISNSHVRYLNQNQNQNHQQYRPVPPPKPKNYKPPVVRNSSLENNVGSNHNQIQQHPQKYQQQHQHTRSFSNSNRDAGHYYNMSTPDSNNWDANDNSYIYSNSQQAQTQQKQIQQHHQQLPPPQPQQQPKSYHYNYQTNYNSSNHANSFDNRIDMVDLQNSREKNGSAFDLYRKPLNVNSSFRINQTHEPLSERATATNNMQQCNSINDNNKFHEIQKPTAILNDDHGDHDSNFKKLTDKIDSKNERDYTSAILDHNGGLLVNEYWGVTLSVPENAIPFAIRQQVYFAVSDPRKCPNIGPLDTENGEKMLSPLVMCGPQGIEFLKPVTLTIPHYANTLPSLSVSLKATNSECNSYETSWDNILLPSNHTANTVAVKVDHF